MIEIKKENFKAVNTSVEIVDDCIQVIKTNKLDQDDANTYAKILNTQFHNGTIEMDVYSKLTPEAPSHARGFIGIAYRINEDDSGFESLYIRPTNGRNCDDPVRKAHGCQYFSYPGFDFAYFRERNIDLYENSVDTIDLHEWIHFKAEIKDEKAKLYVNDELVLTVEEMLQNKETKGNVGLYVDIGTEGYFKNIEIKSED